MRDFEDVVKDHSHRFACKEFDLNKKISKEDMENILEIGRLSPSSFGFEPWKFLVVKDKSLIDQISKVAWGIRRQKESLNYLVIILAGKSKLIRYNSKYIRYMIENIQIMPRDLINSRLDRFKVFQEEDFRLLDDERFMFEWSCRQTYIPLANMLTAASEMGIDSCPMEGFNRELLEDLLVERGYLDSSLYGVSVMAAFGYRRKDPDRNKTRRPFKEVVQWIE